MKGFVDYLKDYFRNIPLKNFLFTLVFVAALIALNYTLGIESRIRALSPWPLSFAIFFGFYFCVFGIAYCLQSGLSLSAIREKRSFGILLLLAPLFFSLKMIPWDLSFITGSRGSDPWNHYWLILLQLPVKLLVMIGLLYGCWQVEAICHQAEGGNRFNGRNSLWGRNSLSDRDHFYGLTARNFSVQPHFQILLLLSLVVALASTQHDFLWTYPKVKNISFLDGYAHPAWPWKLLYEISYGLDFVSIELFFRGFLVLGFVRFAGIHAILPMAAFYCTIHFGKPPGECISSFFGGLALGVIAWRSRTILGGLIVHLGLAWMMEIGGWLGNSLIRGTH